MLRSMVYMCHPDYGKRPCEDIKLQGNLLKIYSDIEWIPPHRNPKGSDLTAGEDCNEEQNRHR
jgi:hypothetical protein